MTSCSSPGSGAKHPGQLPKGPLADATRNRLIASWLRATADQGSALIADSRKQLSALGTETHEVRNGTNAAIYTAKDGADPPTLVAAISWNRGSVPKQFLLRLEDHEEGPVRTWLASAARQDGDNAAHVEHEDLRDRFATTVTPTVIAQLIILEDGVRLLAIAPRRTARTEFMNLPLEPMLRVANRWSEPPSTAAEQAEILAGVERLTEYRRTTQHRVDRSTFEREQHPPREHAHNTSIVLAEHPYLYGMPLAIAGDHVVRYAEPARDSIVSKVLAGEMKAMGCAEALAVAVGQPGPERAATLARECQPDGKPLLDASQLAGCTLWQSLLALSAEHTARRQGIASTRVHRAILKRLLTPARSASELDAASGQ